MRKIGLLFAALMLTACGDSVSTASLSDWVLQNEGEFSLSVPPEYERIVADKIDMVLPTDFVVGFSEIRLDSNFASTLTVHKEVLSEDYLSSTYMQGLRENNQNLSDYAEKVWQDLTLGSLKTFQSEFTFSMAGSEQKVYVVQSAAVKGRVGYVISCLALESEAEKIGNCSKMVGSFSLK